MSAAERCHNFRQKLYLILVISMSHVVLFRVANITKLLSELTISTQKVRNHRKEPVSRTSVQSGRKGEHDQKLSLTECCDCFISASMLLTACAIIGYKHGRCVISFTESVSCGNKRNLAVRLKEVIVSVKCFVYFFLSSFSFMHVSILLMKIPATFL